jgi:hypothetical protein
MRLVDFIASNIEPILLEWEIFARSIAPGTTMDVLALRDHAGEILQATVRDMLSEQSPTERSAKSKGQCVVDASGQNLNGASEKHAVNRLGSGFNLLEVVSEYRALRASVLRLWEASGPHPYDGDVDEVTRFNESIDQSLAKAVSSYTQRVDQSRDLFLAILSHDLRNPLNSIAMSAALLPHLVEQLPETINVVSQIATNADVMARMISDLLDYPYPPGRRDACLTSSDGSRRTVPGIGRRIPHCPSGPEHPHAIQREPHRKLGRRPFASGYFEFARQCRSAQPR